MSAEYVEPYVALIRGISDEDHAHAVTLAQSRGFDAGWVEACRYLESDLRQNKRQFGRRLEDRFWREVRRRNVTFALNFTVVASILFVMIGAIAYLSEAN